MRAKAIFVSLSVPLLLLSAIIFVEPTFITHVPKSGSYTWHSLPVERYGVSRLSQQTYYNRADGTLQESTDGRCFADVLQAGTVRRIRGWKLTVRAFNQSSPRTLEVD